MRIASADIGMQAEHSAFKQQQVRESLRQLNANPSNSYQTDNNGNDGRNVFLSSAISDFSAAARALLAQADSVSSASTSQINAMLQSLDDEVDNNPFLSLLRSMIEIITGQKVRVFDLQNFSAGIQHIEANSAANLTALQNLANNGIEYQRDTIYDESETTKFAAQGTIRTEDGKEIDFNLNLEMSRQYHQETHETRQYVASQPIQPKRKDPLVINFNGSAAQLAQGANQRFQFDIDLDGKNESLPLLGSGSGFLALDLNHDGKIEAKELFGPQTDNGFGELAQLDGDHNGWIDENDPAFAQLSVWQPAASGNGTLHSLREAGVGALALAHIDTPFELHGNNNREQGIVKSSGIFFQENGKISNLQEIDLTT